MKIFKQEFTYLFYFQPGHSPITSTAGASGREIRRRFRVGQVLSCKVQTGPTVSRTVRTTSIDWLDPHLKGPGSPRKTSVGTGLLDLLRRVISLTLRSGEASNKSKGEPEEKTREKEDLPKDDYRTFRLLFLYNNDLIDKKGKSEKGEGFLFNLSLYEGEVIK